jgi:hypothetical protein
LCHYCLRVTTHRMSSLATGCEKTHLPLLHFLLVHLLWLSCSDMWTPPIRGSFSLPCLYGSWSPLVITLLPETAQSSHNEHPEHSRASSTGPRRCRGRSTPGCIPAVPCRLHHGLPQGWQVRRAQRWRRLRLTFPTIPLTAIT